ncbi:MAG: tail fiber domain-containing protein, partial [Minisyncoccia bacterium]
VGSANQNGFVGIGASTNQTATTSVLSVGNSTSIASGKTIAYFTNAGGTAYLSNLGLNVTSDIRLKKNIEPLAPVLAGVLQLQPVTYNFNSEASGTPTHTGFIAQQVQPIFPDLVSSDSQGYLSLNYAGLTPYLVSAVQSQQQEIDAIASSSATAPQIFISNGAVTIGSGATSTVTINAGTFSFASAATTTIVSGANTWTIATSSTSTPIVSISTGSATTSASVSINGVLYVNGQNINSEIASTTNATSTPAQLVSGSFASATASLQSALSSTLSAINGVAQSGVRELGLAVHASVGVFDNLITQTLTATTINADTVNTQKLCVGTTCVTQSQLQNLLNNQNSGAGSNTSGLPGQGGGSGALGGASSGSASSTDATSTPTVPPTISINGDNPATINVGDTYADLGATISDTGAGQAGDANLGLSVNIDGGATTTPSQIVINTSIVGTHTIIYSATDQNGLTGTATRTVNVVDQNATSTPTN